MKKYFGLLLGVIFLLVASTGFGQDTIKKETKKSKHEMEHAGKSAGKAIDKSAKAVGKAAKKVGHKTAEVSSKGYAKITDKVLEDRKGPHGETVYVNKYNKKYYINKKGHKVYLR
ncbi:MAG TPA: hypothetical protein VEV16_10645 [Daejeonella sp.]|nr:hypothetical protein [Daejeonella sp.]